MFKLNIECTKDIEKLHIDFSDGTSAVTTTKEKEHEPRNDVLVNGNGNSSRNDCFLDTDEDFTHVSQEVVELPAVPEAKKSINVAKEMQNLDI